MLQINLDHILYRFLYLATIFIYTSKIQDIYCSESSFFKGDKSLKFTMEIESK